MFSSYGVNYRRRAMFSSYAVGSHVFVCDPGAEPDSGAKVLEARRVIRRSYDSEKIDV